MARCSGLQRGAGHSSAMDASWEEAPPPSPPAPPTQVLTKQKADDEPSASQHLPDTDHELLPHTEVPPQATAQDFWSHSMMMDTELDRQPTR